MANRSVDLDRLQTTLLASKLQQSNPPLYQVILQLIANAQANQSIINQLITGNTTDITALTAIVNMLIGRTYWTENDETSDLPNSRMVVAGSNINLNYGVSGEVEISATGGGSGVDHVVMSDGALPTPSPVNDGFGNFIYVMYTP